MRILFLTQVLPYPLDAGPKIRSYFTMRYLAEKHSVTLVSFVRPSDSPEAVSHLKSFCAAVETVNMPRSRSRDGIALIKSLLTRVPFLITRDQVGEMSGMLKKLVRNQRFDVIHADQLWMAPYALMAQKESKKNGNVSAVILDQHNAVYLIPKRMAESSSNLFIKPFLKCESILMAGYEQWACKQFNHVVWVTQEDLDALNALISSREPKPFTSSNANHRLLPSEKNTVIPICFETSQAKRVDPLPVTQNILFLGGMHWPPNADGAVWFAREVFPLVRKRLPQANFLVVGRQPPNALKSFGECVITPGYVENTDSYWENSRVFVVPLRAGGGMRVKILDAWARGIPIISTTIGAEGIAYSPEKDILIADTPDEFAFAVHRVLTDDDLACRLSLGGLNTLENYYQWKMVYPAWDRVYGLVSATQTR